MNHLCVLYWGACCLTLPINTVIPTIIIIQLIDTTQLRVLIRINFGWSLTGGPPIGVGAGIDCGEHLEKRPRGAKG